MKYGFIKKLSIFLSLSFAIPFMYQSSLHAASRYSGIKKVIVIDFYDKTKRFNGAQVADKVRNELRKRSKFYVLSKKQTLAKFKKLKISRRKMLRKSYRKAIGRYLGVDGIIIGIIGPGTKSKYKLTLKMERIKSQRIVRTYSFPFNKYIGPKASKAVAYRFLGKSGRRTGRRRVPTPVPTIAPEPYYAEPAEQFEPDDYDDGAPIQQRALPSDEEDNVPEWVAGDSDEEEKDTKKKSKTKKKKDIAGYEKPERDWLTLKFAPAFFKNSYTLTNPAGSPVENLLTVNTGFFPGIYFSGEVWFLPFLGIDFMYNMGFLTLQVNPPGQDPFNVKTTFWQLGGGIKYRYHFMKSSNSPYVFAKFGYVMQKFNPGDQSLAATPVLSSNSYSDITFGIGTKVPFWFIEGADLGLNFSFDYFVKSSLSEGVVNNGLTNSASGYQIAFGPYWRFYKWLFTGFDFIYNHHSASFSNPDATAGTRTDAVDGAGASDNFLGILLLIGINL